MKLKIWLAYVSYPITTAVYFERALRAHHTVMTLGPQISKDICQLWHLENLKVPVTPQDISLDSSPDMETLLKKTPKEYHPDLYIWIESVNPYLPKNLNALKCPTACYLIDSHLHLDEHIEWAKNFDFVFIAQKEYLDDYRLAGIKSVHWLPLGCDPDIHSASNNKKMYDIGFVGGVTQGSRREELLAKLSDNFPVHLERSFLKDMSNTFAQSKVVFNNAVNNDLNMRIFEVLCSGSFLLTDRAKGSGLEQLFVDGVDLAYYDDETIVPAFRRFLYDDRVRERIAKQGRETVLNAHTYAHRCNEMLDVIFEKRATTSTVEELRMQSLSPTNRITYNIKRDNTQTRSFVIPVLDYQPLAPYNINSLLEDLQKIDGTVIVVFNNPEIANELKNHPRIDYYAIMSHNFGVPRAWNIGLNMSETEFTYILNSDLMVTKQAIETIETAFSKYPDCAIAGPQGSFFDFVKQEDIVYYGKSSFTQALPVDAVSGFFFAVRTELFHSGKLIFENAYTPCYFEEWDTALQARKQGYSSIAVPTFGYYHEFNIVKRTGLLSYLRSTSEIPAITARNTEFFYAKWLKEVGLQNLDEVSDLNAKAKLLISGFKPFYTKQGIKYFESKDYSNAAINFFTVLSKFPEDAQSNYYLGILALETGHFGASGIYLRKAVAADPNFEDAKKFLEEAERMIKEYGDKRTH